MKNEIVTKWQSHIHPEAANFMQVVRYMHVQRDGKNTLYWSLANSSVNDNHFIKNITLSHAQCLYMDPVLPPEPTEAEFQDWLKRK